MNPIVCLVFFLWHPEYLTQRKDPDTGKQYDQQLGVIAQMPGIPRAPSSNATKKRGRRGYVRNNSQW